MKVLISFLLLSFIAGGIRRTETATRHTWILIGCCMLVTASFLSLRLIK